jgi:hypothetical protein
MWVPVWLQRRGVPFQSDFSASDFGGVMKIMPFFILQKFVLDSHL